MVNKYKFVHIVLYSVLLYITTVIYFPINHTYKCLNSKSFLPLITEGKTRLVYKARASIKFHQLFIQICPFRMHVHYLYFIMDPVDWSR